jgi:hypothetical protein
MTLDRVLQRLTCQYEVKKIQKKRYFFQTYYCNFILFIILPSQNQDPMTLD